MTATVTHFEIYANDLGTLAAFYRDLFGWQIEQAPGVDYFMIQTGSAGGSPIRGGLSHRPIEGPRSWVHYISVDSLDETVQRVEELGGSVVRPRTAVPKVAWYSVVADPEGNIFALWQPDPAAFPGLDPEE
jgi:predicted enzyme related to lactoylglutathione lyase